ncbi:DUF4258 domain-containing protein [Bradyrhizobium symbiodeficiens]|uniref:DUF4258 domain-containing protein n=1 Tax=Bradyrhizobium symbiodeficiens TaxID=1404367 RepID=UPI000BA1A28B|nr:DUF4258 domain-containing protein [Bradyrhizobium symbiodeficiens]AWM07622.1 DUF4258 domain-containing protein [Bradyrhizobium symbiodeficiens]
MAAESGDDPENPVKTALAEAPPKAAGATPEISRSVVNAMMLKLAKWPSKAPPPNALLELIRALAKQRRVGFLDHSEERLAQRGFDVFDVYQTLEKGYLADEIEAGANEGEWKVKIVDTPEGTSRKMGVVTIVVKDKRLLIKTVEWEDR